LPDTPVAWNL